MNKKGTAYTLGSVPMIALAIGVGVIVLSYIAKILGEFNDSDFTVNSTEEAVLQNGTKGLLKLGKQLPTVGLVVGVALIIGVIGSAFYFGRD